jgi:hypothetical protein
MIKLQKMKTGIPTRNRISCQLGDVFLESGFRVSPYAGVFSEQLGSVSSGILCVINGVVIYSRDYVKSKRFL